MSETNQTHYQLKLTDRSTILPDEENPWADDSLNRTGAAEYLANLLSGQRGPLTVALDGPWGSGKTFFLTRFRKDYERANGATVYFNAWSDDFLDDPLLSLLGQLTAELGKNPNDCFGKSVLQALPSVLKNAGFALCKSFVRNTLKIDLDTLSMNELATRGEKLLSTFTEMTASRNELRDALETLGQKVMEDTQKPLLIIVDELDRCRPTFAVELLERIKHLFSMKNIVFLLGIDRKELEKSISAVYGAIDAQKYLNRVIDVEFPLPAMPLQKFVWVQLVKPQLGNLFCNDPNKHVKTKVFAKAFAQIATAGGISLREVEHAFHKYAICPFPVNGWSSEKALLSAYAVGLKMSKNVDMYNRFVCGECKPKEIIDAVFLHFDKMDFLKLRPRNPITHLYRSYYILSDDNEFRQNYKITRAMLKDSGGVSLDRTLFPNLTRECSTKELDRYFGWIEGDVVPGNIWKTILSEIDYALSSVGDLP